MADISKITLPSGDEYNIKDSFAREELAEKGTYSKPSTGIPYTDLADDAKMVILSYGKSTWAQFLDAYTTHRVVYCRASSNSNPASGSQTRLAFMAYVNNETSPTEVEFQYYRSVSSHSDSQQGDQVYVYKLNSSGTWTVTIRSAFTKIVAESGLSSSYSNGTLTITNAHESKTAAQDGTDVSLVTTGEKYIWNNKASTSTATTTDDGLMSAADKIKLNGLSTDATTVNGHTVNTDVPTNAVFTDTTYESKTAVSEGTDVSLVTTGEKYIWNNKADTTAATTSSAGLMSATDKTKLNSLKNFYLTDTTPSSANSGDLWFIIEEEEEE